MARKPRIEFPGAIYHVINRGNYRRDLFKRHGTAEAFERTLLEACERCGWELAAYCIMSNHYHLALATPKGNLVEGVQWLQSTFGNRFNRFVKKRGHVFQGRYKAILVEPGLHLAQLVNYIHLNPVRAGLTNVSTLEEYSWSSFPKYLKKRTRPEFLRCDDWLKELGGLRDNPSGWRKYREYLAFVEELDPTRKEEIFGQVASGWVYGGRDFQKAIGADFKRMQAAKDWGGEELRELNEMEWEELLAGCLDRLGKGSEAIGEEKKSAEWKVAVAWWLKRKTSVNNRWLSERLNMGAPAMVSRLCGSFERMPINKRRYYEKEFTSKSKGFSERRRQGRQ